jgi:hypothetical protein
METMKHTLTIILLLVIATSLTASGVRIMKADDILKEADAIAEAVIMSSVKKEQKCEQTVSFTIRITKLLRGAVKKNVPLIFRHNDYIWNEKYDCPSVHYTHSPRAGDLRPGAVIVVTIKYFAEHKANRVTSSFTPDEYKAITNK